MVPRRELILLEIRRQSPDVLLSDIGMPAADGYDPMRSVRALAPHPSARIAAAALTGFGRTEDRRKALDAGFLMHLMKPLDPAEVIAVVLELAQFAAARWYCGLLQKSPWPRAATRAREPPCRVLLSSPSGRHPTHPTAAN